MCVDCRLSFLGSTVGRDKQFILIKPQEGPHAEMHLLKSSDERGREGGREEGGGGAEIGAAHPWLYRALGPLYPVQSLEGKVELSHGEERKTTELCFQK